METPAAPTSALVGAARARRRAPVAQWVRNYPREWLRADVVAGVTLAAYLLPSGLGDASLANLPPEAGLYACLFSGLVFWLFCSSRHTAISVTSAISLLIGSSLGELAGGDAGRFRALAACVALLVAVVALAAWLLRAGAVVSFISETVMLGFKCGVALLLTSTQLPKLFGIGGSHGDFWERSGHFISHIGETNVAAVAIGTVALAVLVAGKLLLRNKPVAVFVVVAGIVATPQLGLETRGVKLLGNVPHGLPGPKLPVVAWSDVNDLLPLALACFLIGAVETVAIGRMFVARHGGRFDSNREFLALAASNFAAGIGQGFPVSGGISQSLVNEGAGARTPLSGFVAALIILVVTLFFAGPLRYLPQPVLAAVVLVAVMGLFNVKALRTLWRSHRGEFVVAVAALLGVLGSGLLRGVLIGVVISLVLLLRHASRPHVAVLGRIPGTRRFSDVERHPDNEMIAGVVIFRPESGLFYFNVGHVCDTIMEQVRARPVAPERVVIDLSASPYVDVQGAEVLSSLAQELHGEGIEVQIVEARSAVRDMLRVAGADTKLGGVDRFRSVADVVDECHAEAVAGKVDKAGVS